MEENIGLIIVSLIGEFEKLLATKKEIQAKQEQKALMAEKLLNLMLDLKEITIKAEKKLMENEQEIRTLEEKVASLSLLHDEQFTKTTKGGDAKILLATEGESLLLAIGKKTKEDIPIQEEIDAGLNSIFEKIKKTLIPQQAVFNPIEKKPDISLSPPKTTIELIGFIKNHGEAVKWSKSGSIYG